ncbi:MAG: hypothetical protein WBP26_00875 [Candidatus Saccharimonadales bacterium]
MTKARPLIFSFVKESDVEGTPRIVKLEVYRDILMQRVGDVRWADSVLTNAYLGQPEITEQAAEVPAVEMEDIKNPVEAPLTVATIDAFTKPIDLSGARDQVTFEQQSVAAAQPHVVEPVGVVSTILLDATETEEEMNANQTAYVDALTTARGQVDAAFEIPEENTLAYEDMNQKDLGLAG